LPKFPRNQRRGSFEKEQKSSGTKPSPLLKKNKSDFAFHLLRWRKVLLSAEERERGKNISKDNKTGEAIEINQTGIVGFDGSQYFMLINKRLINKSLSAKFASTSFIMPQGSRVSRPNRFSHHQET
jgi:hypothetical protein